MFSRCKHNAINRFGTPAASNPWVSGTPTVATVNSTGLVTGIAPGTSVITYTNSNGCQITATVTVTQPTLSSSLTPPARCSNVSGTYTATSATSGVTYTWTRAAVAGISNPAGSGNSGTITETLINTTVAPVNVVYAITLTTPAGCTNTQNVTQTVNPTAAATANPASQIKCSGVAITTISLTSTTGSVTFNWVRDNTATVTGIAASGSGTSITGTLTNTTASPVTVTFTITPTFSGCDGTPTTATVLVNPKPAAGAITGPSHNVCIGSTLALTASGSGIGTLNYSWSSSATSVATVNSSGVVTGVGAGNTNITYTVTDANGCTSVTSPTFTVTVTKPTANAITQASGITTICVNSTVQLTSNATGTGTLTYTWASSANTKATVSSTGLVTGVASGTANITYTVTDGNGCSTTSASYLITVNAIPTGTFSATETSGLATNDNKICAGDPITFTAPSGYGSYIFKVNGGTVQTGTGNTYSSTTLPDGASVTVDIANASNCAATFGPIVITVNPLPTPTLVADKRTICAGDTVNFTATGGTNYNFRVNGSSQQSGTSATYTTTILADNDAVTVDVTNGNGCTSTSTAVFMTVNPLPSGTLSVSPSATICAGTNVTFTAPAGAGNIYDFKVDGVSVGVPGPSNTYSTNTLTNGQIVSVLITNSSGCFATLNPISITVNALPTGTLTATENSGTPNDNSICANTPVDFTATPGYSTYDFQVNGTSKQNSCIKYFQLLQH